MFPLPRTGWRDRLHATLDLVVEFSTLGEYRLSEALVPVPAVTGGTELGGRTRVSTVESHSRVPRRPASRERGNRCGGESLTRRHRGESVPDTPAR